jgi:hypothetical protein
VLQRLRLRLTDSVRRGGVFLDEFSKLSTYFPRDQQKLQRLWNGVNRLLREDWPAVVLFADTFWFARHIVPSPPTGQSLFAHSHNFDATAHIDKYRAQIVPALRDHVMSTQAYNLDSVLDSDEYSTVEVLNVIGNASDPMSSLNKLHGSEMLASLAGLRVATTQKYLEDLQRGLAIFPLQTIPDQTSQCRELESDLRAMLYALLQSFRSGNPAQVTHGRVRLPRHSAAGDVQFSYSLPERNGNLVTSIPTPLLRGLLAVQWVTKVLLDPTRAIMSLDLEACMDHLVFLANASPSTLFHAYTEDDPKMHVLPAMEAHFLQSPDAKRYRKELLVPLLKVGHEELIKYKDVSYFPPLSLSLSLSLFLTHSRHNMRHVWVNGCMYVCVCVCVVLHVLCFTASSAGALASTARTPSTGVHVCMCVCVCVCVCVLGPAVCV